MDRLSEAGSLNGMRLAPGLPKWERSQAEDVVSIVHMLDAIGQLDRIRPLFIDRADDPFTPGATEADPREEPLARIRRALNVETLPPRPEDAGLFQIWDFDSAGFAIEGYDVMASGLLWSPGYPITLSVGDATLDVQIIADALQIAAGETRLRIAPDMMRSAIADRLAAVENQPGSDRPAFLVELTVDGKRLGLLFNSLAGKMTADRISISGGHFALLLRREDWTD
jgi:hypothetical protein